MRDSTLTPELCEDYIEHPVSGYALNGTVIYWRHPQLRPELIDATRTSDNMLVYIKRVPTQSEELKIALMLSSESLSKDPKNHCVPVLDHFQDEHDSEMSYMVMPFLLPIDRPPFETVNNVVDFADQILEVRGHVSALQRCAHIFHTGSSVLA